MTAQGPLRDDRECCQIDLTPSVEDYLKCVFGLTAAGEAARISDIADRLDVTASSASLMVSRLRNAELVIAEGWGRVSLSEHGMRHARSVVRRHRLLETLLHRTLGLDWTEVHDEADVLEHAVSDRVADLIDDALGSPTRDPHGDPIPGRTGGHVELADDLLRTAPPGSRFTVRRVLDRDHALLRRLSALGVRPGTTLLVGSTRDGRPEVSNPANGRRLDGELLDAVRGAVVAATPEQVAP